MLRRVGAMLTRRLQEHPCRRILRANGHPEPRAGQAQLDKRCDLTRSHLDTKCIQKYESMGNSGPMGVLKVALGQFGRAWLILQVIKHLQCNSTFDSWSRDVINFESTVPCPYR